MKLRTAFLALVMLTSTVAHAQVETHDHRTKDAKKRPPPPPPPPVWDATGWTSLGEKTVNGKADHDTLEVGAEEGNFGRLMIVVEDSDLEMFDIIVRFGNGEKFSPSTRLIFAEGSRTGAIDLPGDTRVIKKIDFKYGNLPGSGKARVRVYGMLVTKVTDHRDPPPVATFDDRGWTKLGSRTVNGKKDKDTIKVGAYEGRFDQLTFVVSGSDLEVTKFTVSFVKGKKWSPRTRHHFQEGSRTRAIDLPGNDRRIKKIELRYKNVAGGGRATVTVYGRDTTQGLNPGVDVVDHRDPKPEPAWVSTGWTLLGEATVDGKHDHDVIPVKKSQAKISKIMLVVLDSDLELDDVVVNFRTKLTSRRMKAKHSFKEGQRTRGLDLPKGSPKVKSIDLVYGNTPGTGSARVQVWGQ